MTKIKNYLRKKLYFSLKTYPMENINMIKIKLLLLISIIAFLLVACGGGAVDINGIVNTNNTNTSDDTTEVDTPAGPIVGGTWVFASLDEPDTLDPHNSVSTETAMVMNWVGGTILSYDVEANDFIPYLAESYSLSEDGLLWEIKFKEGLMWHDGTPFHAQDYVWTMERVAANPSPATGAITNGMISAEAVDDLTVLIHMERPNSGMEFGLTSAWMQPLPRAYIEEVGEEEFSRHPIGLGPFKFKEWRTGDRIILERNPDFTWGPEFTRGEAPYIEYIELRIVPEYSTRLAGLETGEIDSAIVYRKDVERMSELGTLELIPKDFKGLGPYVLFNVSKPPFDDVLVRKAFNLAINREEIVRAVLDGVGEPLWGVVTPATLGHWDGDKEIGYGFDLEAAKALMAEAGYTLNEDGILEKAGVPLELVFKVSDDTRGNFIKTAQVLVEQFKELGVVIEIEQLEYGVMTEAWTSGDYTFSIENWGWSEAQIMSPVFLSSMIGGMNESHVNDPALDELLMAVYMAPNRRDLQIALDAAQQMVIEKAYVAPLTTLTQFYAVSERTVGESLNHVTGYFELYDAYLVTTE
jgi:peptide/nickel transport system substrate-binding protein